MARIPVNPAAVYRLAREVKAAAADFPPLLLAGAPGPLEELRSALLEGGDPEAVRDRSGRALAGADLEGAGVLLYAIEGDAPSREDEQALRLAERKNVEAVCLLVRDGARLDPVGVHYVLATDVIDISAGEALPFERIAERVAERAGEKSYVLAAKLPALRKAVCDHLVRRFSRQNGILGAAVFVPGADLPALTVNQIRMVLRIAAAYGEEIDRERALELLAVVGAGFGFRALARELAAFVPGPGWAIKGAIAYAGTRALGEGAAAYFEARGPRRVLGAVRSRS